MAIPTETVYGLAGNALDKRVISRIFTTKNRPEFDPLIVHCGSLSKVPDYADIDNPKAKLLAKTFWPGPLTMVLPKKEPIPYLVTSGLDSVAIRVPSHKLSLELLNHLDFPLVAPSANPFGYISPTTSDHVQENLGSSIDYILDGGKCELGIESTIIKFDNDLPRVLRLGSLSIEKIQSIIGKVEIEIHSSSNPAAPGMLKSHYSPSKPLILGPIESSLQDPSIDKAGILSFSREYNNEKILEQIVLSPKGDLEEAAANFFSALRALDKKNINLILAEKFPDSGLGRAINDRLKRAAAK